MTASPLDAYRSLVNNGTINPDPIQIQAMTSLQALDNQLVDYAQQMGKTGWLARLSLAGSRMPPPKGFYFHYT